MSAVPRLRLALLAGLVALAGGVATSGQQPSLPTPAGTIAVHAGASRQRAVRLQPGALRAAHAAHGMVRAAAVSQERGAPAAQPSRDARLGSRHGPARSESVFARGPLRRRRSRAVPAGPRANRRPLQG